METRPFYVGDLKQARVLVIGHDPRLQTSHTQAEYAFFADYFFKPIPARSSERAKYGLAQAVFAYIGHLTSYQYTAQQLVLTNLCNAALPHAPKGRTTLIPEDKARAGVEAIQTILSQGNIEVVCAMSQQVNYWLQKLEFYPAVPEFLDKAEPRLSGVQHDPPYYDPRQSGAFQLICGQCYSHGKQSVYPILHVKSWPLRGAFARAYRSSYENLVNQFKRHTVSQLP